LVKDQPLVSINIPTLNSVTTLGYCLKAIRQQTYGNIELIVIDSYSSDKTVKIALDYGAKVYYAKGLLRQRLTGIKASLGKYILLLDSDQVLERTVIEECVKLQDSLLKCQAIILNEVSVPLATGRIAEAQADYVRMIHKGDWEPILGTALPRFYPSSILKQINPTKREIGYFDHVYLYQRVIENGVASRFCPAAIVHHYELNTVMRMVRKFYKYYGFYILPALVEDSSLVFGRVLPRRIVFGNVSKGSDKSLQILLYGVKALATSAGALNFVLSSILGSIKRTLVRKAI
jgi:glycosyltransferase involved in cell wall biosynthesis